MKQVAFLFVGVILIAVGLLVTFSHGGVRINHQVAGVETATFAKHVIGYSVAGLGAFFIVLGVVLNIKSTAQTKRNAYIVANGIPVEARVTFVDKNYFVTVNNKPIYSIIEYIYQDKTGATHTRKIDNFSSDLVIRMQIEVGKTIPVRYLAESPAESVIVVSG